MSSVGITVRCLASTRVPRCGGQEEERVDEGDGQAARGLEGTSQEKTGAVNSAESDHSDEDGSEDKVSGDIPLSPSSASDTTSSKSATPEPLQKPHHTSCIQEAQLSPDGSCIFTSDYNRVFSVYPISSDIFSQPSSQSLTPYASFRSPNPIWAFAVNPLFNLQDASSTTTLISRRDSYITLHNALWDVSQSYTDIDNTTPPTSPINISQPLASYKFINNLTEAVTAPISLAYTHTGTHFFGGSQDKIAVFDMHETNKPIHVIPTIPSRRSKLKGGGRGFKGHISALSLSPSSPSSRDGILAAGSRTRHIGLYDAVSGTEITGFALPGTASGVRSRTSEHLQHLMGDGVTALRWSPCANYLYVAERNANALLIYDVRCFSLALGYCVGRKALTKQKLGFDVWHAGAAAPYQVDGVSHEVWAGGTDGKMRVWKDAYAKEGAVQPDEVLTVGAQDDEPVVASLLHSSGSLAVAASGVVRVAGQQDDDGRGVQRGGGGVRPRYREWGNLDILALS